MRQTYIVPIQPRPTYEKQDFSWAQSIEGHHMLSNGRGKLTASCEAKPTTLKRPSLGDGFEDHMCHIKARGNMECTSISTSSQLT